MNHLMFIARVAFICNGCMFITLAMRYVHFIDSTYIQSTIIIAGFLLSFIFNIIAAAGIFILIIKKQASRIRPAWLFSINFLCLIFQLYLFLK